MCVSNTWCYFIVTSVIIPISKTDLTILWLHLTKALVISICGNYGLVTIVGFARLPIRGRFPIIPRKMVASDNCQMMLFLLRHHLPPKTLSVQDSASSLMESRYPCFCFWNTSAVRRRDSFFFLNIQTERSFKSSYRNKLFLDVTFL